ncbi:MAG: hypothetical protein FJ216_06985 [Ignavibacteria bacterium]|nr:hypothetical protein [Ignavibacteria bacterium]
MENSNKEEYQLNESDENSEPVSDEEQGGTRILDYTDSEEEKNKKIYNSELLQLFQVSKIDKELLEIEEERGDLPAKIELLQEEIKNFEQIIVKNKQEILKLDSEKENLSKENKNAAKKIDRYDEEKFKVRSNKEYDEITRAIDHLYDQIDRNDTRNNEIEILKSNLTKEIEDTERNKAEIQEDLKEKKQLLDELNKETEMRELELKNKRVNIMARLDAGIVNLYERINKTYTGEAIAILRNENCSGCFNSIPPQKAIEIKMANQIFVCQTCGRILIDESIVPENHKV